MKRSSVHSNAASKQQNRRQRVDNEGGQAAIVFLFIVGMVAVLALYIYMGPVMDAFSSFHNTATQGPNAYLPVSQERQDAIFITQLSFQDFPIIFFVLLILACVVAALKWRTSPA